MKKKEKRKEDTVTHYEEETVEKSKSRVKTWKQKRYGNKVRDKKEKR